MKFARYLEEQSVPEWKRAYINYRGMKKLIKRVQQRREKRLSLALEKKSSKSSHTGSVTRSATGGFGVGIRRRGTTVNSKRSHGDLAPDGEIEGQFSPSQTANYQTFENNARVTFNDRESGSEVREDELPKVTLNGTGLKLLTDYQSNASKQRDAPDNRILPIPQILSNITSNVYSGRSSIASGEDVEADEENRLEPTSSNSRSPNLHRSSGTWDSRTITTNANADDVDSDETNVGSSSTNHKGLRKSLAFDSSSEVDAATPHEISSRSDPLNQQRQRPSGMNSQVEARSSFKLRGSGSGTGGSKRKGAKVQSSLQQLIDENFDEQESQFFSASDAELERILDFYEQREKEMKDRFTVLARQLKEVSVTLRARQVLSKADDTSSLCLNPSQLAEHRREYKAKHPVDENGGSNLFSGFRTTSHHQTVASGSGTPLQNQAVPSSIDKPRASAEHSEDEGDRRRSIALAKVLKTNKANLTFEEQQEENERAKIIAHDPERYKNARKKLKAALVEYYRTLELLRNFKILNRTGFQKCMKKLEKTVVVNGLSEAYYKEKVAVTPLVKSDRIEKLIKATEDIFTAYFEHGNRKHALERLRAGSMGPVGEMTTHHFSVFRTGIYLGIALCATVAGIVQTQHPDTYLEIPNHERLYRVYGALFLPAIFALLFGLNLAAWHRARINTIFIFEWDVRHAIDYRTYFEMPAFFLLLLSLAFWVSFLNPFPDSIAPTTWPMVWIVAVLLILLNPIPITIPQSRSWFVKSIIRVFQAGLLHGVEFRDFFLGDELNSLAWSISNLWLIGCEYNREWKYPDQCDPNGTFWTAALTSIPAFLRLIQCFRRFRDSGNTAFLHLVNAGKYSSAILYYWFYHNYRFHGSHRVQDLALWIVFATIYSVYTSSWDILMDWSLLRRHARYPLLRNELAFESVWPVYYFSIISNIILRFSWTIYLMPGPASMTTKVFVIALLEVMRRFQWNFYRLENEHLGNVDQYRVSKDVPLPYKLSGQSKEPDDDEEYDSGKDQNKSEGKNPFERFRLKRRSLKAERNFNEIQEHDYTQDLASSDNDSNHHRQDSNGSRDPDQAGEQGSTIKAKIRRTLAPDADTEQRIDNSGAARGVAGKDYVRKNDDSDSD